MSDPSQVRKPVPRAVGYVGLAMIVVGVLAFTVGTIGVSDPDTGRALSSMALVATGAAFTVVGWRLRRSDRWAYVAAVVLLSVIVVGWVVRAVVERESWFLGQLFGPGVGLWALFRPEVREHFAR